MKTRNPFSSLRFITASVILATGLLPTAVDGAELQAQSLTDDTVHIAVRAHSGVEAAMEKWGATAEALSQAVPGYTFELAPMVGFEEMRTAVENGAVDFVLTNPTGYVELEARFGASRIVTLRNLRTRGGSADFASAVFTRADRDDVGTLGDVAGHSVMGVHPEAFGGWLMLLRELKDQGIDPFEDADVLFSPDGTHESVVRAVMSGEADIGTVRTGIIEGLVARGELNAGAVKVLDPMDDDVPFFHSTRHYPEWPFATLRETSAELAKSVAIALLAVTPNDPAAVVGGYTSWTVPLDYARVHDLMRELRVGPYEDYGRVTVGQSFRQHWTTVLAIAAVVLLLGMLTVYVVDITKRRRAAESLRASNRALTVLSECNEALVRADEESNLLHDVCRLLVEKGGYRLAWVGLAEWDEEKSVRPAAQVGYEEGYLDGLDITWADTERGQGPTGSAIRTGWPVVAQHILTDSNFAPWREAALHHGFRSSIALPLVAGGRAFGALNVYASASDAFSEQEVSLLLELADNVAFGTMALRTREKNKRAEEELREKERFREGILNDMTTFVGVLDPSGHLIFANNTPLTVAGIELADVTGKKFFDAFWFTYSDEARGVIKRDMERCAAGESVVHDMQIQTADGSLMWIEYSMHPIFDEHGVVKYLIPEGRDITERKQAEEALAEAHNIISHSPAVAILWKNEEGWPVEYVSGNAKDLFGYTAQEFMAGDVSYVSVVHADDMERVDEQVATYSEEERRDRFTQEYRIVTKDGQVRWIDDRTWIRRNEEGEITHYQGILLDITERKRAEEELRRNEVIVANSSDALALLDKEYTYLAANPAYLRLFGKTYEQLIGSTVPDAFGEEFFSGVIRAHADRCLGGAEVHYQRWIDFPGPGKAYMDIGYFPYLGIDNEITGFVVNARDITARKRAEDELRESEEKFRVLTTSSPVGVFLDDAQGNTVYVNEKCAELIGLSAEETLNLDWVSSIHPEDREWVTREWAKAVENSEEFRHEYRWVHADGEVVWTLGDIVPVIGSEGEVTLFVGTLTDITERKRAEESLGATEQRFRSLFEHVPVALWEEDFSEILSYLEDLGFREMEDFPEYLERRPDVVAECAGRVRIIRVNDAALTLHGAESHEELLQNLTRTFTVRSYEAFQEQLVAMWRGADSCEAEAEVRTLSGDLRQAIIRWSVPPGGEGSYSRVLLSMADVTELETARRDLSELNVALEHLIDMRTEQLVAANDEMEAFAYSVSHDLKAPLRAIDGYSGMLEERHESSLPADGQRLLRVVRENAQQMAQLIDDLLAFSRIGRAEMVISDVDMGGLAKAVFSDLVRLAGDRTVELSLGRLPTVRGDLALIRQVWMNLLQNALKFTTGRDVARIEVDCQAEPDHWVFRVRDNGAGFDMAYADKLFGVFQRLHYQEEFPGTGVGLANVHRIIHRHGGEVWAEGEVDVGATIFFRLPHTARV